MAERDPGEPTIDEKLVRYLCRLSRLSLTDEEIPRYAAQLEQIVGYVRMLDEVPTEGIEPTSHVLELANVTRPDVPVASAPREKILANAPCATEDSFKVPKIV
ncbi:MAG: Asp-tRNA(Asn)/Glu-tRNA(Gln) amidotransferase subunit GatC [Candidatus Wallbacteria bacterium]|nr:Asp-tRNA(Asn)/Glu-tRNA(Gln) amidotransferase subunit GatC [Candidatus Wallbacteria bacterium]